MLGFGAAAIGKCTSLAQCQDQCAQAVANVTNARYETDGGVGCCYCPVF